MTEVCASICVTPPCPENRDGNEEFWPIVITEEASDWTVALTRDDLSRTRSATTVLFDDELFRRSEISCPATRSAGPVKDAENEDVLS